MFLNISNCVQLDESSQRMSDETNAGEGVSQITPFGVLESNGAVFMRRLTIVLLIVRGRLGCKGVRQLFLTWISEEVCKAGQGM